MGCFWPKYIMFELKKYRGVTFHDTRSDTKFEEKFSPEQTRVSKLGLSLDPFIQSIKCMSLKFTGDLCVMKMKNNAKFEKELTCQFKIDMRNLTNFDLNT